MKTDLFETPEQLPKHIQAIISKYGDCDTYEDCANMLKELNKYGYTFNYYLDAQPYNLRLMVSNKTKHLEKSYFETCYELNRPLRELALQKYYKSKPRFKNVEDAKIGKCGNWICLVTTPENNQFYTIVFAVEKWIKKGCILGQWNELTFIQKAI